MHLLQKFTDFIKKENLFQPKDKLLLAVSGGVDSVVLCELCKQAGFDFVIAHCNFQLRDEESERDEKFVRELAWKYDVEIFVKRFETEKYAEEKKIGIQEAARNLRYSWFLQLWNEKSKESGPLEDKHIKTIHGWHGGETNFLIATAHHANDNIETLLMNFFKGTGITGLQGILPKQTYVVRPLLFAKKEELQQFANEKNLSYVEDSSNESDKYTRNYFRNQLIPSIQKVFPQVEENLLNNIQRFNEVKQVYEEAITKYKNNLIEIKGNEEHIPILKLKNTLPFRTMIWEIIKEKGFSSGQVDEVAKLMGADNGSYIKSEFYRIIKNRKWLIITHRHLEEKSDHIIIDPDEKDKRNFEQRKLNIEKLPATPGFKIPSDSLIAFLDADVIKFPLLLRKWKRGDYFYPLGMNKKKKLSKFFIDQKLSMTEKENVWVLEMNRKIIWIVGKRIDDRFKITPKTKNVLKISLH